MSAKPKLVGLTLLLVAIGGVLAWRAANEGAASGTARAVAIEPDVPGGAPPPAPSTADVGRVEDAAEQRRAIDAPRETAPPAPDAQLATIAVRFTALETGAPLEGEPCLARDASTRRWTARPVEGSDGGPGEVPRSGADGIVRLRVPPGSYVVSHAAPPHGRLDVPDLAAGETRPVAFELRTRSDLVAFVRVLDAERDAPLAGVEVRMTGVPDSVPDATRATRTDADGLASLRLPSWLELTGAIDEQGFGSVVFLPTALHDTPEAALVLRLQRCAALRGEVLDRADAPIADARVELECYESELGTNDTEVGTAFSTAVGFSKRRWGATTDAEGRFELAGLPPGSNLELALRIEGEVEAEDTLRLQPGEERSVTYRVGAGALLRGVLLDVDGVACARTRLVLVTGARSRLLSEWEHEETVGRTDAEGAFELANVALGDWLVGPQTGAGQLPWLTHVHVPEGVPVVDVVLRLPRAGELRGRTVGPAGEAVPNVRLEVRGDNQTVSGESDAAGVFHFEDLVEGEVRVRAKRRAGDLVGAAPVLARTGDTDVVVELVPGATLSVYVCDEQGRPVVAEVSRAAVDDPGTLGSVWFNTTNEQGLAVWSGVPPGLVRTLARVEGGAVGSAGPTRMTPGEDVRADITVRAGGRLHIHAAKSTKSYGVTLGGMLVDFGSLEPGGVVTTKALPVGTVTVRWRAADGSVTSSEATVRLGETVDVEPE